MQDLTRFGLALLSAPIVVVTSGVLIGLIARWISGRRTQRRPRCRATLLASGPEFHDDEE